MKLPYLSGQVKYLCPSTLPSFLPKGSSNWTPIIGTVGLKWVIPTNLTVPLRVGCPVTLTSTLFPTLIPEATSSSLLFLSSSSFLFASAASGLNLPKCCCCLNFLKDSALESYSSSVNSNFPAPPSVTSPSLPDPRLIPVTTSFSLFSQQPGRKEPRDRLSSPATSEVSRASSTWRAIFMLSPVIPVNSSNFIFRSLMLIPFEKLLSIGTNDSESGVVTSNRTNESTWSSIFSLICSLIWKQQQKLVVVCLQLIPVV